MPTIQDYSEDDDNKPDSGGNYSSPSAGLGGPQSQSHSAPTPQREPEFVPWERFVNANQDVSQREAGKLNSSAQNAISGVKSQVAAGSKKFGDAIEQNYEHTGDSNAGFGSAASAASGFGRSPGVLSETPTSTLKAHPMETRKGLTPGAVDNPSGYKDIESAMGPEAWSSLLGNAESAESQANSLGSETGVQSLLQKQGASPNSAFDAALISGAGRKAFGETAQAGKGLSNYVGAENQGSQNAWQSLLADESEAQRQRKATAEADAFNASQRQAVPDAAQPTTPTTTTPTTWHPDGFTDDVNSFLGSQTGSPGGVYQDVHTASQYISPADWITRGLGEAGVNVPMASEAFSGGVAGDLAPKDQWRTANVREGMKTVAHEYGEEAVKKLWASMTPEMWAAYMALGNNPGRVAAEMRAWLESAGFKKQGRSAPQSEVRTAGATRGEADQGTTDEEETARTNAYREGWGTQWDEQFRNGNRNPVNPNG